MELGGYFRLQISDFRLFAPKSKARLFFADAVGIRRGDVDYDRRRDVA